MSLAGEEGRSSFSDPNNSSSRWRCRGKHRASQEAEPRDGTGESLSYVFLRWVWAG